jgi:hypothetical protein
MVRPQYVEQGATELCHAVQCGYPDLLSQLALVVWIAALTLLTLVAFVRIANAEEEVTSELSRIRAERNAYRRFRKRVSQVDASRPQPSPQIDASQPQVAELSGSAGVVQTRPPDDHLSEVRDAYEETVMSVPHYEEDYGESLARHMQTEFGDEVTAAVVDGDQFSPQLKQALLQQATTNQLKREKLMRKLEEEFDDLSTFKSRLRRIDQRRERTVDEPAYRASFEELTEAWHELDELEAECEDLLAERQSEMRTEVTVGPPGEGDHAFHRYLYSGLESAYPILSVGVDVYDRVREAKRDVTNSLARRV